MKILLAITVSFLATSAFAEDLNAMKKSANEKLDKQMSMLQKNKSCINDATTVEKFKACKLEMKNDMNMQQKMEEGQEKFDDAL